MILILPRINFLSYSNKKNLILNRFQNQYQIQNIQILTINKKILNKFNLEVKINLLIK